MIDKVMQETCKLVDSFAILVQLLMATLALLSLLYKRSFESPKRPLVVWAMDTSKQGISASLVHLTNIMLSYISAVAPDTSNNPCVWYFLNLLMDTTLGVYILYIILGAVNSIAQSLGVTDVKMGVYGNPPRFWPWMKQLVLFLISWFFVKVIISISLLAIPIFGIVAEWLLSPLAENRKAQVIFVMFLFPLVMNIIQAWLTDLVIKAKCSEVFINDEINDQTPLLQDSQSDEFESFHTCSDQSPIEASLLTACT